MSNLLEKASILLTPTAYDDGRILSVKPSIVLGSELVTNGDFASPDISMITGAGVRSIVNGELKIEESGLNYSQVIYSNILDSNKIYKATFDITLGTGSYVVYNTTNGSINITESGTHTFYLQNTNRFYVGSNGVGDVWYMDNISVKEDLSGDFDFTRNSSATRVNSQGLIEDITSNLPRIDYSPYSGAGTCGHWLFEPQSTNLVEYSEDLSQSSWIKQSAGAASTPSVTPNFAISPEGTQSASRVVFDLNGGTTSSDFSQLQENISGTVGNDYTSSVYLKSNNSNTYSVTFIPVSGSTTIVTVTPEWQRFSLSATLASANLRIRTRGSEGSSDVTDILIWGAHVEQQSFATSYIPTSGSTVTRSQEAAFGSGNSSLINSTEGTLYAEIAALTQRPDFRIDIALSDGTSSGNVVRIHYLNTEDNKIRVQVRSGGVITASQSTTVTDIRDFHKIAISYKVNEVKFYIDGVLVNTDTNAAMPIGMNQLSFSAGNDTQNKFYGKAKCVAVFKEALTDDELECLTSDETSFSSFNALALANNYTII